MKCYFTSKEQAALIAKVGAPIQAVQSRPCISVRRDKEPPKDVVRVRVKQLVRGVPAQMSERGS